MLIYIFIMSQKDQDRFAIGKKMKENITKYTDLLLLTTTKNWSIREL